MKSSTLTQDKIEILDMINNGYSTHKMAALVGCSQPNIYKKVRQLKEHGYVKLSNKYFYLTPSGTDVLKQSDNQNGYRGRKSSLSPDNLNGETAIHEEKKGYQLQRLHNFQVKYELREKITEDDRLYIGKLREWPYKKFRKLRHHTDVVVEFENIKFILTSRSLILSDIEEAAEEDVSTIDLLFRCFEKADGIVEGVEKKLRKFLPNFALRREGEKNLLKGEIIKLEIAHTNDVLAKNVLRNLKDKDSNKKFIINHPETGKPDILVDHSHDTAEWEFVNKDTAIDYNEKYRKFKNAHGTNERYELFAKDFLQEGTLNPWEDRARIEEISTRLNEEAVHLKKEIIELQAEKERDINSVMSILTTMASNLNQTAQVVSQLIGGR